MNNHNAKQRSKWSERWQPVSVELALLVVAFVVLAIAYAVTSSAQLLVTGGGIIMAMVPIVARQK